MLSLICRFGDLVVGALIHFFVRTVRWQRRNEGLITEGVQVTQTKVRPTDNYKLLSLEANGAERY